MVLQQLSVNSTVRSWRLFDLMSKRFVGLFSLLTVGLFIFVACADPQQPTATPVDHNPTPAGGAPATATPSDSTPDPQPTPTASGPDVGAGETIFTNNGCSGCHSVGDQAIVGPGLLGIGARAETRVPGQSADEYLISSIKAPQDFVVAGFEAIAMPAFPQLSDQEINDLVGYLKSLQ